MWGWSVQSVLPGCGAGWGCGCRAGGETPQKSPTAESLPRCNAEPVLQDGAERCPVPVWLPPVNVMGGGTRQRVWERWHWENWKGLGWLFWLMAALSRWNIWLVRDFQLCPKVTPALQLSSVCTNAAGETEAPACRQTGAAPPACLVAIAAAGRRAPSAQSSPICYMPGVTVPICWARCSARLHIWVQKQQGAHGSWLHCPHFLCCVSSPSVQGKKEERTVVLPRPCVGVAGGCRPH